MRILHVTAGIGRSNGVMSVILNYARYTPPDIWFDVMYFVQTKNDRKAELEALGGTAIKIAPPGLHSFFHDDVDDFLAAHRGEYSAIHLHLPYLVSVFALKAHHAGINRLIAHCHTSRFSLESRGWRNRLLNIPTKALADDLIACSRDAGDVWYGKRAVCNGRVIVLPNAIDCRQYRYDPAVRLKIREKLGIEGHFVAGHVGTLSTPKNHRFLLQIFSKLYQCRSDAVLLLVGEGALRERLAEQASEMGFRDQVIFLGDRNDVPQLLQAMDVFFFPSLYEGLGIAAVEAQAAGLPTIVSDRVPCEACITECSKRLPLEAGPAIWADTALELSRAKRRDGSGHVADAGFNLSDSASWLAAFYKNQGETGHDAHS